jgi:phosphoglucosamine mutase
MGKLFGTDGVRGVANEHPMTAEMAMNIGRATAHLFKKKGHTPKTVSYTHLTLPTIYSV